MTVRRFEVVCCLALVALSGCAGYFTRSTPPTSAYQAIHQSARSGEVATLEQLYEKDPGSLNRGDADGNTPLMLAAMHGHSQAVSFLLGKRADVNAINANHQTALILAAKVGQKATVEQLLDAGADRQIRDARGWTAGEWAARQGFSDIARLISSGSRPNTRVKDL